MVQAAGDLEAATAAIAFADGEGGAVHWLAPVVSRSIDVVVSLLLIAILSPVILVVAALVAVTSSGPVLFRQIRVGRGGTEFTMLKFRSMWVDTTERILADPELRRAYEANAFKLPSDHDFRTPIGRFLRRTSLDELPQLFQVLAGTMSLVGVRPIEPRELAGRSVGDRRAYLARRPGLTGLWQVSGRSSLSYEERCALDHEYVSTWSIANDVKILLRTPMAVARVNDTV